MCLEDRVQVAYAAAFFGPMVLQVEEDYRPQSSENNDPNLALQGDYS
jgi:hypothetical protein